MESEQKNESEGWPPSNYPIFLALVLLAATAVTLAMGDESQAEELAIYAYYFLVLGVAIRFFELALPEKSVEKLVTAYGYTAGWIKRHSFRVYIFVNKIFGNIIVRLKIEIPFKERINVGRYFDEKSYISRLQRKIKISFGGINASRYMDEISYTTRNIAIFLSVFFLISLVYGMMIDWLYVKKYLYNLVLIIFGFLTLHIITRRKSLGE